MVKIFFLGERGEVKNVIGKNFEAKMGAEVFYYSNLEEAYTTMRHGPDIFAIVVDSGMEYDGAVLFYDYYKKLGRPVPLVFIGEESFLQKDELYDFIDYHECNDLISWPFDLKQFNRVASDLQNYFDSLDQAPHDGVSLVQGEYFPLKFKNLYLFEKTICDIYCHLSEDKYLKIIEKNKPFLASTVEKFTLGKTRYLYAAFDDQVKVIAATAEKIGQTLVKKDTELDLNLKIDLQIKAIDSIHEYLRNIGVGESVVGLARALADSIRSVSKSYGIMDLLKYFGEDLKSVAERSLLTAYFSFAMAKQMGWDSPKTYDKLALSSFVFDVDLICEKMGTIRTTSQTEYLDQDEKDQELYLKHPEKGADYVELFDEFPPEIAFIVRQHHELPGGIGFPNKISISKVTQISAVFNFCSNFVCELYQRNMKLNVISAIIEDLIPFYYHGPYVDILRKFTSLILDKNIKEYLS